MSQEKVNLRKEYKKNRKEILAKEKRKKQITKVVSYLCLFVIVAGIGFSVYKKVTPEPVKDSDTFFRLIQTDDYGILDPSLEE